MGGVVPDRFFWALPPGEAPAEGELPPGEAGHPELTDDSLTPPHTRNVH
jgi:hydroxymethylpyrimidine/phosphomethylpyrimidine kinase